VLSHGRIIIPEESKLLGHVTEVKARGQEDTESRLGIVFDKVLLKHHEAMDFQGVVQALAPPVLRKSKVDEPDEMLFPSSMSAASISQTAPLGGGGPSVSRNNPQNRTIESRTRNAGAISSLPVSTADTTSPNPASTGSSLSIGMPQGVFGLKGLSLSKGASSNTPGPVILSRDGDVKLEFGTQVLLRVTDAPAPRP